MDPLESTPAQHRQIDDSLSQRDIRLLYQYLESETGDPEIATMSCPIQSTLTSLDDGAGLFGIARGGSSEVADRDGVLSICIDLSSR